MSGTTCGSCRRLPPPCRGHRGDGVRHRDRQFPGCSGTVRRYGGRTPLTSSDDDHAFFALSSGICFGFKWPPKKWGFHMRRLHRIEIAPVGSSQPRRTSSNAETRKLQFGKSSLSSVSACSTSNQSCVKDTTRSKKQKQAPCPTSLQSRTSEANYTRTPCRAMGRFDRGHGESRARARL